MSSFKLEQDNYKLDDPKNIKLKKDISLNTVSPGTVLKEWRDKRGYILIFKRKHNRNTNKAIIFIHGGSFTELSPMEPCYKYFGYVLCKLTGYDIICPDFSLPPEKTYPEQLTDIEKVYKYYKNNYNEFIVGGDSSGGCIALSVLLKYSNIFSSGFIISGWLNLYSDTISYKTREYCKLTNTGDPIFKDDPKKNKKEYQKYALKYLGKKNLFKDPIADPYYADDEAIKNLPPTLFMVGDRETIRNDTLNFGSKAQKLNKNIFINLYDNMWHDWIYYLEENSHDYGVDAYIKLANFCNGKLEKSHYKMKNENIIPAVKTTILL